MQPAKLEAGRALQRRQQLDQFLGEQEQQAFRIARLSVRHDEDALDLVQDAMLNFVSHYSTKPQMQWRPLFYKVLYNKLTDFHRRSNFRRGLVRLFHRQGEAAEEAVDELDKQQNPSSGPMENLQFNGALEQLSQALSQLSERQRQVVLLRSWQGFDTAQTAAILALSSGSVKTHYARGLARLRELLGSDWP